MRRPAYNDPAQVYCPEGVQIVQVGIILTAVFEILIGLLIMRVGKAALDRILPPIVTGSMAMVIGIALAMRRWVTPVTGRPEVAAKPGWWPSSP